jgi:hypothetical protein
MFKLPSAKTLFWTAIIALTAVSLYNNNQQVRKLFDSTIGAIIPKG